MEAKRESHQNLRHLLQFKEEDHHHNAATRSNTNSAGNTSSGGGGRRGSGLTLLAILSDGKQASSCRRELVPASTVNHHHQVVSNDVVLSTEQYIPQQQEQPPISRVPSNRTLLDILREEQTTDPLGGSHQRDQSSRIRWSLLKNIVRLHHQRRSNNNNITNAGDENRIIVEEETASSYVSNSLTSRPTEGTRDEAPAAARMSLMALLEENDRQMGLDHGSAYGSFGHVTMIHPDKEEEEHDDDEQIINGKNTYSNSKNNHGNSNNSCCVCMVRHKGAAFIPCGHTFCRLCSRELWVQRGNCPLCNNYILEILDIF